MTAAQSNLLARVRAAGGSVEVTRQHAPGYERHVPASVWRSLQRQGLIRVARVGNGRFRITEVRHG